LKGSLLIVKLHAIIFSKEWIEEVAKSKKSDKILVEKLVNRFRFASCRHIRFSSLSQQSEGGSESARMK
jgi:hypothetical protein